jgi:glycerate 2-kinase
MKIVIAPDSFKESLTSLEAASAIERGFMEVFPDAEFIKVPMADGGEGTVQSLVDATGGRIVAKQVTGPLGAPVQGFFGISGDGKTAIIEMAAASGLHLVPPDERNPLITTTRGTGELMVEALNYGVTHLILGIGGSATNDGGAGMVQALGGRLLDREGKELGPGGGVLHQLAAIDLSGLDSRFYQVDIEVACDVDNPLTGPRGATAIFGPQKGATSEMVDFLDTNLAHYASVIEQQLGRSVTDIPGAGAAGGLGAGLLAFLPVRLRRGVEIVLEAVELEKHVKGASLVITGEGKIDGQTAYGKTPIGVAATAKMHGVPVLAIAGNVAEDSTAVYEHGIDCVFSIIPGVLTLDDAFENAASYMYRTSYNLAKFWKAMSRQEMRAPFLK